MDGRDGFSLGVTLFRGLAFVLGHDVGQVVVIALSTSLLLSSTELGKLDLFLLGLVHNLDACFSAEAEPFADRCHNCR